MALNAEGIATAQALDTPSYHAHATTCGITFTFGSLRISPESGQGLDVDLTPMPGLFCAGEWGVWSDRRDGGMNAA